MWTVGQFLWPLVFVVVLWGLGFATATLAGLRNRRFNVALAIPLSVAAVAMSTLVHVVVPLSFGWPTVVVVLAGAASVTRLVRRFRGHADSPGLRGRGDSSSEGGSAVALLVVLGMCSLTALVVVFLACGGSWELVSQTWDAMFDANATRYVYETGLASPLQISDFVHPQPVHTYYPSTFHAMGALYMQLTGSDAVVATNVVAAVLAGALWPSVAVVAAWIVVGPARPRPTTMALLSGGFWALPWAPLGWGVLWATALAAMFVPLVVAGVVALMSPTQRLGRRGAGALVVGGLALVAVLHPRIGLIFFLLLVGLGCWWVAGRVVQLVRTGEWLRALAFAAPSCVVLAVLIQFLRRFGRSSSQFGVRVWPVDRSPLLEVQGYAWNGPAGSAAQPITALAILVGLTVGLRRREMRPLAFLALGAVLLDVLTATVRGVWAFDIVARFWYNDRTRTMAVAAAVLVVLAAVGWRAMSSWWAERIQAFGIARRMGAAAYPTIVATLALVMGTTAAVPYLSERYVVAANHPTSSLVTLEEVEAFRRVAEIVPEGELILNNSNDGSALLYAYVNRKPALLVAGLEGSTPNATYLRDELVRLELSSICRWTRSDGIRWVINNGRAYSGGIIEEAASPNLMIPPGFPLTTERLRMGHTVLYELTGCPS